MIVSRLLIALLLYSFLQDIHVVVAIYWHCDVFPWTNAFPPILKQAENHGKGQGFLVWGEARGEIKRDTDARVVVFALKKLIRPYVQLDNC